MTGCTYCEAIDPGFAKPAPGLGGVVCAAVVAQALPAVAQANPANDRALIRLNCEAYVKAGIAYMGGGLDDNGPNARRRILAGWLDQCLSGEYRALEYIQDFLAMKKCTVADMEACGERHVFVPVVPRWPGVLPYSAALSCTLKRGDQR